MMAPTEPLEQRAPAVRCGMSYRCDFCRETPGTAFTDWYWLCWKCAAMYMARLATEGS